MFYEVPSGLFLKILSVVSEMEFDGNLKRY